MASFSGRQKIQNQFSIGFEFEGVIQASVRGYLVVELIKYFLFQRQQIPMAFDQLAADVKCEEQKENSKLNTKTFNLQMRSKIKTRTEREIKKKKDTIQMMEKLFETLVDIFSKSAFIKQIVLLFGSTIVSPKEIVIMNFPTAFFEGPILSRRQCLTKVFHKLVSEDFLGEAGTLKSIKKLSVMILQQRNCEIASKNLIPKLNFKLPTRGKKFELHFACHNNVKRSNGELSILDETNFDISGIEPLNRTLDKSVDCGTPTNSRLPGPALRETSEIDCVPDDCVFECTPPLDSVSEQVSVNIDPMDYIWYQLPITVTGFKDKTSAKLSSTGDLMM